MSSGSGGTSGDSLSEDSLEASVNGFQPVPIDFQAALNDFRVNWQRELQQNIPSNDNIGEVKSEQQPQTSEKHREAEGGVLIPIITDEQVDQLTLAKNLFHKAVELEQSGKVYDALAFYRKAVQIEPNIEFKYYEQQKLKTCMHVVTKAKAVEDLIESAFSEDLYEKFHFDLAHSHPSGGKLIRSSREPGVISTEMHISELPPELLIYILRWVVSSQLDIRSLENCAAICKGMYILARDEELWKSACAQVWAHNLGTLAHSTAKDENPSVDVHCHVIPRYSTWREMFIERERVLFNGCYISKTTYLRMGENSFQDQYYRPVQLVEYYRYIRFLPDGTVLMMTNSDEPAQGVAKLKHLQQLRPDILRGHYRLFGSTLSIVVSKQQQQTKFINEITGGGVVVRHNRRGSTAYDESAMNYTKYCIEFRILSTSKRKFAQLAWLDYSIVQMRNKHETTSEFELTPSKYPPLWFSPVRSYHSNAEAPLP